MGRTAHIGEERVAQIRRWAEELGFSGVGFSKAERLETEEPRLAAWLAEERHGRMAYLEKNFDKRRSALLLPGTKTVISSSTTTTRMSARRTLRRRRFRRMPSARTTTLWSNGSSRSCSSGCAGIGATSPVGSYVDSAPILERAWAAKSGLGWIGKHGLLLNKEGGSHFFLGEILVDLDLPPDAPVTDHCGDCTRCIDVCPTQAIIRPQVVDGSRCISYFTIELRDALPEPMAGQFDDWMFGCDLCQEVCP